MKTVNVPERIFLVDHAAPLVRAWTDAFEDFEFVSVRQDDFFSVPADAMLSPANSFGIMDGGLDLAIRDRLGFDVQRSVQRAIIELFHGELPVGAAVVVETGHASWPHLVVSPTMRVPENVAQTLNAYLAFRAALLAISRFNVEAGTTALRTVLCPGLGTGIGGMAPARCAVQMRIALQSVTAPARIASFAQIHATHRSLRSA
jgi:O-acetyl-ADP-ribose deacetylase (regulator of RNase III)